MRLLVALGPVALISETLSCDPTTKAVAVTCLGDVATVDVVPGMPDLRYAENRDVALGLF